MNQTAGSHDFNNDRSLADCFKQGQAPIRIKAIIILGLLIAQTSNAFASDRWIYVSQEAIVNPNPSSKQQTKAKGNNANSKLVFYQYNNFQKLEADLSKLAPDSSGAIAQLAKLATFKPANDRELWSSDSHDVIHVAYIYKSDSYQALSSVDCGKIPPARFVQFKETERNSAIIDEIIKIGQTLIGGGSIAGGYKPAATGQTEQPPFYCTFENEYTLSEKRANMTITLSPQNLPSPGAQAKGTDITASDAISGSFITGPEENWFLTLDATVNTIKQLKYDTTNKAVTMQNKPGYFYLSLDRQVGDALTDYDTWSANNFVVKLMVSANSTPLESVGLGLGYVLKHGVLGTDKNIPFQLFVGAFRTSGSGPGAGAKISYGIGLSYNIGTLSATSASTSKSGASN